jgi:hypothetical protein
MSLRVVSMTSEAIVAASAVADRIVVAVVLLLGIAVWQVVRDRAALASQLQSLLPVAPGETIPENPGSAR